MTLRTAGDGSVRVTLVPPTVRGPRGAAAAGGRGALVALDPSAATPRDAARRARRARARVPVRGERRLPRAASTSTSATSASTCSTASTTATSSSRGRHSTRRSSRTPISSATTAATDTGVLASGALVVRVRDWLGAWLQTHVDLASEETLARRRAPDRNRLRRPERHGQPHPPARRRVRLAAAGRRRPGRRPTRRRGEARRLPRERDRHAAGGEAAGALPRRRDRVDDDRHARRAGARRVRADEGRPARARRHAVRDGDRAGARAVRGVRGLQAAVAAQGRPVRRSTRRSRASST